jgi:hypothetical protein
MWRSLFAALSVLVATIFASGHSAARGSKSAKGPKVEVVNACMKYREQKLVEDDGLRMELRNCCHGPVKCAVSWRVRCGRSGPTDPRSADLQIAAGATESAYGYGTECGDEGWQILAVRWNCETDPTGDSKDDR